MLIILILIIMGRVLFFEKGGIITACVEKLAVTFLLFLTYECVSPRKCSKFCELISNESMGIYLLHSPLIYFTYAYLANEKPVVVVTINFVICGGFAIILTHRLINSRAKWLIGY